MTAVSMPDLDTLLAGPITAGQSMVITGRPGTGKTLLAGQLAFTHARAGGRVLIVTLSAESQGKLLRDFAPFSFFDESLVGTQITFISGQGAARSGREALKKLVADGVRKHKPTLVVLEGIRALRDMWKSDLAIREFFYDFSVLLETYRCVGVSTSESSAKRIVELAEGMTTDAIVSMSVRARGQARFRRIEVLKYRGRAHPTGSHGFTIDERGIHVTLRLEYAMRHATFPAPVLTRKKFGLDVFDALLHGGLPDNSSTIVAGSTGIGKTLLALQFASAGARAGEPSLIVTFDESPEALVSRAKQIGLDVEGLAQSGMLTIRQNLPLEIDVDLWVEGVLADIERLGAKRVVIDGAAPLTRQLVERGRGDSFMVALVTALRASGATTIFTVEIPKITGPELDFSDTPLQSVAENLILLRHVELQGRFHRLISILKMRASAHDFHLREFVIDERGLRVLEPFASAEGVLTGTARMSSESS